VDQNCGGADLRALTSSFGEAVRLIAAELFPCWERAGRS
jgi:hypothetical protein